MQEKFPPGARACSGETGREREGEAMVLDILITKFWYTTLPTDLLCKKVAFSQNGMYTSVQ